MCVSSTSLEFWQNSDLIISGFSLRPQSTSVHHQCPQVHLQGALAGYFTSQHLRELKCTFFPVKHGWIAAGNRAPAVLRLLLTSKLGKVKSSKHFGSKDVNWNHNCPFTVKTTNLSWKATTQLLCSHSSTWKLQQAAADHSRKIK